MTEQNPMGEEHTCSVSCCAGGDVGDGDDGCDDGGGDVWSGAPSR